MAQLTAEQIASVKQDRLKKERQEMLKAARARIMQGIARNNNRSGERALWELIQNARDLSQSAVIKIVLDKESLSFSHQGEPFDLDTLSNLIKQQSTKNEGDDKVGQYGTGFMTTHVFSRKVYISGDCQINYGNGEKIFVPLPHGFCLDRTSDDEDVFIHEMDRELSLTSDLISHEGKDYPCEWTTFRYELNPSRLVDVSNQAETTTRLMPYALVFNDRISKCTIYNRINGNSTAYSKSDKRRVENFDGKPYARFITIINVIANGVHSNVEIHSIETLDGKDRIIIPPLPLGFDDVNKIPSHFLFFPMLGTENFGTNFIFHSSRLFPTEPRNSYLLPQDNDGLMTKYKQNELVLDELFNMLFDYYRSNPTKQALPLDFANVSFDYDGDDPITQRYFEKLQTLFSREFECWKMIPSKNGFVSIKDDDITVLDAEIYLSLTEEQQAAYIPTVEKYANDITTLPSENVIGWSKVVKNWAPEESDYYTTLQEICSNIKNKTKELKNLLLLLKELGDAGTQILKTNALLPNRDGKLKSADSLMNGITISDELYQIVSPIMGEKASVLIDPDYSDIVKLNEYTRNKLRDDLKLAVDDLRKITLDLSTAKHIQEIAGKEDVICSLLKLCSIFQSDASNYRARIVPILCRIYGESYSRIIIAPLSSDEADFTYSAFNFLLDNTLCLLSSKDSQWINTSTSDGSNFDLLLQFATKYTDTKDERLIKKLNDFGIIPNQLGEVKLASELRINIGVDDELKDLYLRVINEDLNEIFVDEAFSSLYNFEKYTASDAGDEIEKKLMETDYEGKDIILIINHLNKGFWRDIFPNIYNQRESLYYSHGTDEEKEALFRIQMQGADKIKRIAELTEDENFEFIINRAEELQRQQEERDRQFRFTFAIGKLIEDDLRREVSQELSCVSAPENTIGTEDVQFGQDMVISYRNQPIYFIECKAKWNFYEPAHMSSAQMKQAVRENGRYALFCVDCTDTGCSVRPDASQDEVMWAHDEILENTYVHTDIGSLLSSTISPIVNHEDEKIDEVNQIKIYSNLTCNIPKKIFVKGKRFREFIIDLRTELEKIINAQ